MMKTMYAALLIVVAFAVALVGCGGGGATGRTILDVDATVAWSTLSPASNTPESARSVRVTFEGTSFVFSINRGDNTDAYTETYRSPVGIAPGSYTASFTFYSAVNGTGTILGRARTSISVGGQSVSLPTVTNVTNVSAMAVPANQTVRVNTTKDLLVSPTNADGALVALPLGSVSWTVVNGVANLEFVNGNTARGLAVGTATVRASYGAVNSPNQTIQVIAPEEGCTSSTYTPNYHDTILTSNEPRVRGEIRYWTRPQLRIAIVQDANWTAELDQRFRAGVAQWQAGVSTGIPITYQTSTVGANITVYFVPSSQLPPNVIGITQPFIFVGTNEMSRAEIKVASDLSLNDFTQTSSHEFGHAIGIGGHSPFSQDQMYFASADQTGTTTRDLNTLRTIYCDSYPRQSTRTQDAAEVALPPIICPKG